MWGTIAKVSDENVKDLAELIKEIAAKENKKGSVAQKVGDLYNMMMDSTRLNAEGAAPLQAHLAEVDALQSKEELISHCAKEHDDLLFGIQEGFDFVAASFTRTADDIREVRKILKENGGEEIQIIAKIENQQGVDNIDEIIEAADGIMIARGDMGVEIPPEYVPVIQQKIIQKVYTAGKPVITATQMLDSMISHPRPTRAEATDVANAIFQGTSATMLSGETAAGKYPVQALQMMSRIAEHMEQNIDYNTIFKKTDRNENPDITNAIAHATCLTAIDLKARAILAVTKSGSTAHMMSKHRPGCLIGACTSSERVLRQLNLSWGVYPMLIKEEYSSEILCLRAIEAAQKHKLVKVGDTVVFAGGVPLGIPGRTNMIRVCIVE